MGFPLWDQVGLTTATGASGAVRARLPFRGRLFHVAAASAAGNPPVRASLSIVTSAFFHHLRGGWIRGTADPARSFDLSWTGDIPIAQDVFLDLSVRNDSGSTVRVTAFWIGEREEREEREDREDDD